MLLTRVKMTAIVVLMIGVLGFGLGGPQPGGLAAQEPETRPAVAVVPQRPELSARLKELLTARIKAAELVLAARREAFRARRREVTTEIVSDAARRVLTARLELASTKAERVAAWQALLEVAQEIEARVKSGVEVGAQPLADYANAQYYRLDAEIGLERAKAK